MKRAILEHLQLDFNMESCSKEPYLCFFLAELSFWRMFTLIIEINLIKIVHNFFLNSCASLFEQKVIKQLKSHAERPD